jgi:hypothetical protein
MRNTKSVAVSMIVRLTDGSIHRFQFSDEKGDEVTLASRVERALEAHDLVIELDGRLLVIPKSSILSMELSPAPVKMPAFTIRNGRVVGG